MKKDELIIKIEKEIGLLQSVISDPMLYDFTHREKCKEVRDSISLLLLELKNLDEEPDKRSVLNDFQKFVDENYEKDSLNIVYMIADYENHLKTAKRIEP